MTRPVVLTQLSHKLCVSAPSHGAHGILRQRMRCTTKTLCLMACFDRGMAAAPALAQALKALQKTHLVHDSLTAHKGQYSPAAGGAAGGAGAPAGGLGAAGRAWQALCSPGKGFRGVQAADPVHLHGCPLAFHLVAGNGFQSCVRSLMLSMRLFGI